jgi:hypothetical protein
MDRAGPGIVMETPPEPLPVVCGREQGLPPSYDSVIVLGPTHAATLSALPSNADAGTARAIEDARLHVRERRRWRPRTWLGSAGVMFLVLMLVLLVVGLAKWREQLPTWPERS